MEVINNVILDKAINVKRHIRSMSLYEILIYINKQIQANYLYYEIKISLVNHEDKRDEIIKILNDKGYAISHKKFDDMLIINW